ncbi:hypothetical protein D8674_020951 [Pyrus ussuriensis x Pyrus communis]|uniref:BRCT domain-containing protein n=1 Tax=Pyrus ussuriensis x Pyrus communis TaxID=2448454 RepID=A0A5N5HL47_9ROSA|nr:hypothetical protein D8674_020951 [Pyrus ussuriensis x Pyrus communis]
MSHSVDTLGFRPPQFSEDLAWLPGWLQQHQKEQLDECTNELKGTNLELASKDLRIFQGNTSEGKDANTFSHEEVAYESCHLFLSGEDNSAVSFASSPGNVLHFHLHLSSNGYSQCSPLQPLDASQNHLESTTVLSVQLNNTSVGSELKSCSKIGLNVGGINSLPPNSIEKPREDTVPPCPSNNKKSASHSGEKLDTRYLKAADISDAVELSIAASEALVINEIMGSGLPSDVLPTAVVLEAALQVKKARLEWLDDSLDGPAEETENCYSLSDLDDFTMADVYKDVGLSQSIPSDECACDSAISQVKETPLSGILYECVNLSDSSEFRAQCVKFDDIPLQKEIGQNLVMDLKTRENFPPESVNYEREQFHDKLVLGSNISVARYDPSALKNSDGFIMKQTVGAMVDVASFQPQNNVNFCPQAWNSGNSKGEDTVSYLASNRFRSRWLGGWTGQDASATPELKQNTKSVMKCFAGETSFFSESADIAPDVNSFVQVHDTKFYRTSQSSIAFSGLHDEDNNGIMLSQDVATSSSLSSVDPLCSVVPCSISSENASLTLAHNQKDKENHNEECFRPTQQLAVENSHKSSNPIIKFPHEDGPSMPTINGERSPVTVRRQMISLRTYSTLLPNLVSIFDGGSFYRDRSFELELDQRLNPLNKDVPCDRSSDKRSYKESLPSNTVSSYSTGSDNEGNGETTLDANPVATLKDQKRSYHETEGNGNELPIQALKKRRQPLIFNHRSRFRIQASKPLMNNSTLEKHLKLDLLPENVVKLQQNEELHTIQSACKNFPDRDVLVKKRVHFCEADIAVQQNKNLQKLDSSTKYCSNARASKRWKHPKFQNHERSSRTNCHLTFGKRLLFHGIEFLLTGFSSQKEKDIERQIWKHGGIVLSDIPSPNLRAKGSLRSNGYHLPVILCMNKLQTTKFLYGCAVNSLILKVDWLTNSISAGCILLPEKKYMILPNRADAEHIIIGEPFHHNRNYVFEKVGIMLHGRHSFYSKLAKIIKHGGGKVFKTLQWLVHSLDKEKVTLGAIVAEDEGRTSRHLRQCASEQKIAVMPASWIIKGLYLGKLLPFPDKGRPTLPTIKISEIPVSAKVSEDL